MTRHVFPRAILALACVLVEPMMGAAGCIAGERDFLGMLREETRRAGSVLVFDEVMTTSMHSGRSIPPP